MFEFLYMFTAGFICLIGLFYLSQAAQGIKQRIRKDLK